MALLRLAVAASVVALHVSDAHAQGNAARRGPSNNSGGVSDSAVIRARAEFALSQFHSEWRRAWLLSERTRFRAASRDEKMLRSPYVHCHNDLAGNNIAVAKARIKGIRNLMNVGDPRRPEYVIKGDTAFAVINGKESAFGACPTWLLAPIEHGRDATNARDEALMASTQDYIRDRREKVLAQLHDMSRSLPGDPWLSGQRVRLHIDQRNFDHALEAARSCKADAWWCHALEGYVHGRQGNVLKAESAFAAMHAAMSSKQHCAWSDIAILLPKNDRSRYARLTCAQRDSVNAVAWWMADPFLRTAGNERLVQQEVRRVDNVIREAAMHDERYAWYAERGGDALQQLIERYGWPSYTSWGGADTDRGHTQWLESYLSPGNEPYTTFEYSLGRVALLPAWDALLDPFESVPTDWRLASEDVAGEPSPTWWPVEHFLPRRRLVQLDEGQTAFFRRQNTVLVASALRLSHPAISTEQTFRAMLLMSPSAGRVDSIAEATVRGGGKVVLQGSTDTLRALLAVEAEGQTIDARIRYGVAPPPTLSSMRSGDIAISDPVLLEPSNATGAASMTDSVLNAMLPSSVVGATQRNVRVFWESYGIRPGDTVAVTIRIGGDATVGRMRRIGIALNLASDPNNSIETRWVEPDGSRSTRVLAGPVVVQMRSIALDLSRLTPGPYLLEISMQKGATTVRSQRRFSVE